MCVSPAAVDGIAQHVVIFFAGAYRVAAMVCVLLQGTTGPNNGRAWWWKETRARINNCTQQSLPPTTTLWKFVAN